MIKWLKAFLFGIHVTVVIGVIVYLISLNPALGLPVLVLLAVTIAARASMGD